MTTRYPFPHQRLDAYQRALELLADVDTAQRRIPRGYRPLADQLLRAATSVALNLGEAARRDAGERAKGPRSSRSESASRYGAGEKRACFSRARGECGEVAVAIEIAATLGFVPKPDAEQLLVLAGRVAAMLTRLIQRHQ